MLEITVGTAIEVKSGNRPAIKHGGNKEIPMSTTTQPKARTYTQAEVDAMLAAQKPAARALTLKVSEKGCLCVYGLGRWPVALYASQWEQLAPFMPEISKFIKANPTLSRKQ